MESNAYRKIFEPFHIGKMQLKNRIVLPPMGTSYSEEGHISQRLIAYYEARARGGTGLIITEGVAPGMRCRGQRMTTLSDDRYLPGWEQLVKAVHKHGAKIAIQLHHAGYETRNGEFRQVAPSAIMVPSRMIGVMGKPPLELTVGEIAEIVQWFADSTKKARDVGIDAVEIHGAHQYIVASFLSSATNKRQDQYGGSLENKARFLVEIIEAMKAAAGPDYPIWPRINAVEYGIENGVTMEETRKVVAMAVKAGAQAIHASAYGAGSSVIKAPLSDTPAYLVPLSEEIKKVTDVPVIAVGRLDMETGEKALEEGKADLIAIGRRLTADPDLPVKTAEGRFDDIIPCIGCMECIERVGPRTGGVICTINAVTGREIESQIRRADVAKKVAVIGSGPAGMEAARVAALRGHRVTLFEKAPQLGGLLNVACLPPNKGDVLPWLNYLKGQLKKAGVEIRLNTEANKQAILASGPDAVIVAAGAIPLKPDIPGINSAKVVLAEDVLSGKTRAGQRVLIIGGGTVGCETGHYLAAQGKNVVIVEICPRMATELGVMFRRRLMDGLRETKVTMITDAKCEEITDSGVTICAADGQRKTFPVDTIIVATGYGINDGLYDALKTRMADVHFVGDASSPKGIMEAVRDGYKAGLSV